MEVAELCVIMWVVSVAAGRSIVTKKGDGSQVKESTDSSTTLEDDDIKGKEENERRNYRSLDVVHVLIWLNYLLYILVLKTQTPPISPL